MVIVKSATQMQLNRSEIWTFLWKYGCYLLFIAVVVVVIARIMLNNMKL